MYRSTKGYTLLELMLVVILMALITALAAPQVITAVANNAVADASNRTVVIFRKARTNATVKRAVMGVYIKAGDAPQLIRYDVGSASTCDALPSTCTNAPEDGFNGLDCGVDWVDFEATRFNRHQVRIAGVLIDDAAAPNPLTLCVTPSGKMYRWDGSDKLPLGGPVEIIFDRTNAAGTETLGVERRVVISTVTFPRLML